MENKYKVVWSMFFGATDALQKDNLTYDEAVALRDKLKNEGDPYVQYNILSQECPKYGEICRNNYKYIN